MAGENRNEIRDESWETRMHNHDQKGYDEYEQRERIVRHEVFDGEEIDHIYLKERTPVTPEELMKMSPDERGFYGGAPEINQRTYSPEPGIICEQDCVTVLRDGCKMYSDIYRPDTDEKVPVIIAWSWFGKRPKEALSDDVVVGVPRGANSDMVKFEAPDPGYWVHQGYAVANPDPRGCLRSEGDMTMHDYSYGECGYDYIEWLAQQPWCTGKIGMAGNSCVAFSQYRVAQTCPPHLVCIAPWEGTSDFYRESCFEGGIPGARFNTSIIKNLVGNGYVDDYVAMMEKYPFFNNYWQSKIPQFEKIRIPVYLAAGWSHFHLLGTFTAFSKIKSRNKWIRCHRDFEWPDAYNPENLADLKRFFDRYLKGIRNGWEFTPKVRLDVMDGYEFDFMHNRPENEFPLKRTQYTKLYLNAENGGMSREELPVKASVSYDAQNGLTNFDFQLEEDTEITGYAKVHMWVEAKGHDDMDMFFTVKKLDADGNWIPWTVLGEPHPGAWGKQRVSRRELDPELSKDYMPILAHRKEEKLSEGEIVPIDVLIWPSSRFWHKGEQLRLEVAGRYIREEGWFEPLAWDTDNAGEHIIHTGGEYDSYIQIPVIPPKYVAGDTIYR